MSGEDPQVGRPTHGPDTTMSFGAIEPVEIEASAPVGLTPDEVAAVHALPPTSALLVMQRGPSAGARFLLDAERTVAGRSTGADIFLDDVTVSRKHAEFVREGTTFAVRAGVERHAVLADLHLVAGPQHRLVDAGAVDIRAVQRPDVPHHERRPLTDELRVLA